MTKTYLAYGANLNMANMKHRCPDAVHHGFNMLKEHRLVFKNVADIIPAPGFKVPVAIWTITEKCEKALDRFEGYRPDAPDKGLYDKKYWADNKYMAYVMNRGQIEPPSCYYYDCIADGYDDFGIDHKYLIEALDHSHENDSGKRRASKQWG
jgi:hypothetical protein